MTAYAASNRSVPRLASRTAGIKTAMPSQRTATKRHSSLSGRGRSAGPFHRWRSSSIRSSGTRTALSLSGGALGRAISQDRADSLRDVARAERLGHVFVCAAQQATLAVDLLALGAEHDHVSARQRRVLLDLL